MKYKLNVIASVCMMGTLMGCAQLKLGKPEAGSSSPPLRTQVNSMPVDVAAAGAMTAEMPSDQAFYLLGLAAQGSGQVSLAAERYRQVLERTPHHVGALNALAVIYAQSDRTDDALKVFALALREAPSAHIYNNTGYTLLRAGRLEEAELALKEALNLEPSSVRMLQNLALLEKAKAERLPQATLADAPMSSVDGDVVAPRLVAVAPSVYELQTVPATTESKLPPALAASGEVTPAVAAKAPNAELRGVRLEVANGAGISHLARRTADRLATEGALALRLTNALPYTQQETEIQYANGQEIAARALQSRLPVTARLVPSDRLNPRVQVRLVLGHDTIGKVVAAWLDTGLIEKTV